MKVFLANFKVQEINGMPEKKTWKLCTSLEYFVVDYYVRRRFKYVNEEDILLEMQGTFQKVMRVFAKINSYLQENCQ